MKNIKILFVLLLTAIMLISLAGCGTKNKIEDQPEVEKPVDEENQVEDEKPAALEGSLEVSGSTSVKKIGEATAEEFMALNPSVTVTYLSIGSSSGVKNANDGTTPIGSASRNLKEEEKSWGMTEKVIAYDGIAVITHPDNTLEELSMADVQAIYKGDITNWSEVGGDDAPIVVVSREDGSGTRGAFEEIIDFEDELTEDATIAEGNGGVQTTTAGNPNAIGYVSFTYIDETVKPMLIEGSAPTAENVLAGEYPVSRPFIYMYHEENMDEIAKAYMDFVLSADGQFIVSDKGGIPVSE